MKKKISTLPNEIILFISKHGIKIISYVYDMCWGDNTSQAQSLS